MTTRIRRSALAGQVVGALWLVAATSLVACGVPEQDDTDTDTGKAGQTLGSPERPLSTSTTAAAYKCVGFDNGARFCLVKCRGADWTKLGSYPNIDHGKCGYEGLSYCGRSGLDDYCWGIKTP